MPETLTSWTEGGILGPPESIEGRTAGETKNDFSQSQAQQRGEVFFLSHIHTHSHALSASPRCLSRRRCSKESLATTHCLALTECAVARARRVTAAPCCDVVPRAAIRDQLRSERCGWSARPADRAAGLRCGDRRARRRAPAAAGWLECPGPGQGARHSTSWHSLIACTSWRSPGVKWIRLGAGSLRSLALRTTSSGINPWLKECCRIDLAFASVRHVVQANL